MNKKYLMFGLLGLFAVALVTAGVGYYAMFSTTLTIEESITLSGCGDSFSGFDGSIAEGGVCTITNNAPSERTFGFTSDTDCDIETSYTSNVDMNMKDTKWVIVPDTTVVLSYTVVGNEFSYKVDTSLIDYVVVYYPDLNGNPGSWNIENAKLVGDANIEWTTSVITELPVESDWNDKAKLWLIPEADWNARLWNPTTWYFENNLVTFGDTLTLDAESNITIIPLYDIAAGESGDCNVATTIA